MHQWSLLSEVFLVFVSLDVLKVVNTAEALDDDLPIKDSAFSEVIKNITRVNNVLQELIKNYEKLQKIYHSQESIEQYGSQDENMSYGNHERSKFKVTPPKPKDFPATNFPFEDLDGSPEDVDKENKITTGKSHETRTPPVEAQTLNNNKDKPKEKHEKVKAMKAKDPNKKLKEAFPETESSSDISEEKPGALKKKPKVSKEINEHDVPKTTKESEKTKVKTNTEQKSVTKKKVITEYGSMERPKRNSSTVNANSTNNNIVMKSRFSPFRNDEMADLDDNKRVFNLFTTETTDEEKSTPKLKSHPKQTNLKLGSTDKSTTKKKEISKKTFHKEETQKKEKSPAPIKTTTQPYSNRANDKEEDHKKVRQKKEDKELDVVASSEDEKTIKKEQFKTSILRKAYGDACLKVVVSKCYKACKGTLKRSCKVFKCESNFQLQFKEHAKTGCIYHFRNNNTLQSESGRWNLKQGLEIEATKARAEKNGGTDIDGFSDLTRDGYLAAACLPKSRRTEIAQSSSDKQLNILRDRFERECQKVSCSKCNKACEYTVDKTCTTFNCNPEKKKTLRKYCKRECRDSYRSKNKSKFSRSDSRSDSRSSRSRSRSRSRGHSDSGSGSDTDMSGTSVSFETTYPTTAHKETAPPGNATKKDETRLKLRTGRTRKNRNATKAKDRVPKTVQVETFFRAQDTKPWKHTEPTKKYEPVKFVKSQEWKYELASKKKATAEKQAEKRAEDMVEFQKSHEVWGYGPETRTVKVRDETAVTVIYRRADNTKS